MATVAEIWDRIHGWMEINAPKFLPLLNSGASEEKLKELEEKLCVPDLPDDFKDSYRIHDGYSGGCFFGSPNVCNTFLTVDEIMENWSVNKSVLEEQNLGEEYEAKGADDPPEIKCKWWDDRWIPFGEDGCGNAISIDLAPTEAGSYGQVIQWYNDGCTFELNASNFTEFLNKFADDLETDKYKLSDADDDENNVLSLIYKEFDN